MTLTNQNGELVGNKLTVDVSQNEGVYLYVDYTPGAESSITVKPAVREEACPIDAAFSLMANGAEYAIALVSGTCVYPIPVPELSDKLELTFVADGDDSAATLNVYVGFDRKGS